MIHANACDDAYFKCWAFYHIGRIPSTVRNKTTNLSVSFNLTISCGMRLIMSIRMILVPAPEASLQHNVIYLYNSGEPLVG